MVITLFGDPEKPASGVIEARTPLAALPERAHTPDRCATSAPKTSRFPSLTPTPDDHPARVVDRAAQRRRAPPFHPLPFRLPENTRLTNTSPFPSLPQQRREKSGTNLVKRMSNHEEDEPFKLLDVPTPAFSVGSDLDPGLTKAPTPKRKKGKEPKMVTDAEKLRLNVCAQIKALETAAKGKLGDYKYELACINGGLKQVECDSSPNPILRFIGYVSGYAAAFGKGLTHTRYTILLSEPRYWEYTSDRAEAAANGNKEPLLFIIVSKCAADNYAANFLTDDTGNVRPHRKTLDAIRAELEELHPNRHIILIDVPARLLGCAREGGSKGGYKACKAITPAGRDLLEHMLKMLMLTAVSCGITVGGIATVCADINEDWLKQLVNGEASTAPPDLLDAAFAKYKMVRIEWLKQARERIVVGRGLHYVFMHLRYTWAAKMCKKLTALALGCHNPDQDIGADDINVIKQLAFMMHILAGGKNRLKFIKTVIAKLKEDAAEDDVSKLPDHTSELLANLAKIDLPDFLDLTDDTDDDDDEEDDDEEEDDDDDEEEEEEEDEEDE